MSMPIHRRLFECEGYNQKTESNAATEKEDEALDGMSRSDFPGMLLSEKEKSAKEYVQDAISFI